MNCGTFSLWLRLFLFNYLAADARKKKSLFRALSFDYKKKADGSPFLFLDLFEKGSKATQ